MAKLPRSPISEGVTNQYRPVREARASGADPVGQAMEQAGNAGFEIASRMADARLATEAAQVELELSNRLDQERRAIEDDNEIDPANFETMFQERSSQIVSEIGGRITSPALRRAFGTKSAETVQRNIFQVRDVSRRKQVDVARGEFVKTMDTYSKAYDEPSNYLQTDINTPTTAQSRLDAQQSYIQTQVRAGVITAETAAEQSVRAEEAYASGLQRTHVKSITDAIERGDVSKADSYFQANSHEITDPDLRDRVSNAIDVKKNENAALATAERLWSENGGNYDAYIKSADADETLTPTQRREVKAFGAEMLNQSNAADAQRRRVDTETGMSFVVKGGRPPADWFTTAHHLAIEAVQTELQQRQDRAILAASMTAAEKAEAKAISESNYLKLSAQLGDSELVMAGVDAILADPQLRDLHDSMTIEDQNKLRETVQKAQQTGGVPADKTLTAYRAVMALTGDMYGGLKKITAAGEGVPGVKRVSANRQKTPLAIALEGVVLRRTGEELARTGGKPIEIDAAQRIMAQAILEVTEDPKTGKSSYAVDPDVALNIAETDVQTQIINFRRQFPKVWTKATFVAGPGANQYVVLQEARSLLGKDTRAVVGAQAVGAVQTIFAPPKPDDTIRADGSLKGRGYFGPLERPDGMTMTEYSVGVNIDGKDVEIPTLVPTLTQAQIDVLLNLQDGEKPPRDIIDKAIKHARERLKDKKSPFWNEKDDKQ
jgi:ribosomal protein S20